MSTDGTPQPDDVHLLKAGQEFLTKIEEFNLAWRRAGHDFARDMFREPSTEQGPTPAGAASFSS